MGRSKKKKKDLYFYLPDNSLPIFIIKFVQDQYDVSESKW